MTAIIEMEERFVARTQAHENPRKTLAVIHPGSNPVDAVIGVKTKDP